MEANGGSVGGGLDRTVARFDQQSGGAILLYLEPSPSSLSLSFFLIPSGNLDRVLSLSFSWGGHITLLSQNSLHQQLCSTFSLSCPYIGERIGRDCPRGNPVTLGGF